MPYVDQGLPHAGSAEVLYSGMFLEPAGTLARTVPRKSCLVATLAPQATGTVQANLIDLPAGMPVSNLAVHGGSTAEVGGSHFWIGITDLQSNVLFVTADDTTNLFGSTGTFVKKPVTIPGLIPQTGPYYVVVSISAATTMPTLAGAGNKAAGIAAQAPQLYGTMGTQAAPPGVGTALSAIGGAGNGIDFACWVS